MKDQNELRDFRDLTLLMRQVVDGDIDALHKYWQDKKFTGNVDVTSSKLNNRSPYSFAANNLTKKKINHFEQYTLEFLPSNYEQDNLKLYARDDSGRTPLMYAANAGIPHRLITRVFSGSYDSHIDELDKDHRNLLHLLFLPGDWFVTPDNKTVQLKVNENDMQDSIASFVELYGLANLRKNLAAKDIFGMTPIDYAAHYGFSFMKQTIEWDVNMKWDPKPVPDYVPDCFGRDKLKQFIVSTKLSENFKTQLPELLKKFAATAKNPEANDSNALHLAYTYNKSAEFIALIEANMLGNDPQQLLLADRTNNIALHYAVANAKFDSKLERLTRHLNRLKEHDLLEQAINHQDSLGRSAAHILVMTPTGDNDLDQQVEAYWLLLKCGALPFLKDNDGNTPHELAIKYGNKKLADKISQMALAPQPLNEAPKVNLPNYLGIDFIIRCILSANSKLQDYLKIPEFKQAINNPVARFADMAPLHFVPQALKHQTQLAQLLVANGADVAQLDAMQRAPIFYAANLQDKDLISFYLLQKAELRAALDIDGRSLLHAFCMGGLFKQRDSKKVSECLDFLLPKYSPEAAAKALNTPDNFGVTPLMYARVNKDDNLYQIFLKHGFDLNKVEIPSDRKTVNALSKDFYGFNRAMQAAYKCKDPDFNKDIPLQKQTNPQWGGDNAVLFWNEWYFQDNNALLKKVEGENTLPFADNASGSRILHLKVFAAAHNPNRARTLDINCFSGDADQMCDHQKNTPLHVLAMTPKDAYPGAENGNYFVDMSKVLPYFDSNPTVALAKQLIDNNKLYAYAQNAAGQTAYDLAVIYDNEELRDFLLQHLLNDLADHKTINCSSVPGCLSYAYRLFKSVTTVAMVNDRKAGPEESLQQPLLKGAKLSVL